MSVIPDSVQTSVPTPPPAPAVAEEASVSADIAELNALVGAEHAPAPPSPDEPAADEVPAADDDAAPVEEAEEVVEDAADEVPEGEAAPEADLVIAETDTPEEITAKRQATIDTYDLSKQAPEVLAHIEYLAAENARLNETAATLDQIANKDTLIKLGSAMNRMYETDDEGNNNIAPLVEFFQTDTRNEFPAITDAVLSADSLKYPGLSVMEEKMVDSFGREKAVTMLAFGRQDIPLPVLPKGFSIPQGIDEAFGEAYFRLPEIKKFEIEGILKEITELEAEGKDSVSEWRKDEIGQALQTKRAKLDAEVYALQRIQQGYDADRSARETAERQSIESVRKFRADVNTAYTTEQLTLADTFAKDLAPRLTYADSDTQLSQARNILTRVQNALGFMVNEDGSFAVDPYADHYASQLREEGIKFDFAKGRSLLQQQYKAVEKLATLERKNASPQAKNIARMEKQRVDFEIKAEQKALMGQLSTKYVKSNAAALTKQVDAVKGQKQITRKITSGRGAPQKRAVDPVTEISEYNKRVSAQRPEDVFDYHAGS